MILFRTSLSVAAAITVAVATLHAPAANSASKPSPSPSIGAVQSTSPSPVSARADTELLWNSWYTMTIGGKTPFGYYNDRVERRDGKYAYQNQLWKMEEGFINKERVVSFGSDSAEVSPILFNFVANYRDTELVIDGTMKGRELTVKARRGKETFKPILVNLPSKTFFSTLFQVWIGKRMAGMQVGKRLAFTTVFEDAIDTRYAYLNGAATLEAEDEFAKKSGTRKIRVDLANTKTTWYLLPTGEAVRIEKPDQNLVIERKPEAEALRFLVKRSE